MLSSGGLICGSVVVCIVSPWVLAPGTHSAPLDPYITVVKGLGNARRMRRSEMQDVFESAAVDGVLLAPGAAGLAVLCRSSGVYPSADFDIEKDMLAVGKEEGEYEFLAVFLVRLCIFRAFWQDIVISHIDIYIYICIYIDTHIYRYVYISHPLPFSSSGGHRSDVSLAFSVSQGIPATMLVEAQPAASCSNQASFAEYLGSSLRADTAMASPSKIFRYIKSV